MPRVKIIGTPTKKVKIVGLPKHQTGGGVPVVDGLPEGMHHLANIEAEAGEVYQDHDGGINKISDSERSHDQGGAFIPNASRVLEDTSIDRKDKASKKLKMSPDEVDTIFGVKPKRPLSHAKAYEFIKAEYGKDVDRYNKAQNGLNDKKNFDKLKYNTAKLNFINRENIPADHDVFDTLFEHQEAIKAVHGIENSGKTNKYGGWLPKAAYGDDVEGGNDPYLKEGPKAETPQGRRTTEGRDVNAGPRDMSLDEYKQIWKEKGLDLDSYKTDREAQKAVYDHLLDTDPEQVRQMWSSTGLTNFGRQNAAKLRKAGIELAPNPRDPYHRLDVKDWSKLSNDQLKTLNELAYADNNFHTRTLLPPEAPGKAPFFPDRATFDKRYNDPTADFSVPNQGTTYDPTLNLTRGSGSRFYEPTNWYDLAPGLSEMADSFRRDPELYNPVQFHELSLKQLDPTAALRANQGDYNAALQALGREKLGAGNRAANISNLAAGKYRANAQVLAEYENQNAGIKNKEIEYNASVRDRQSMADADSRKEFYSNVLRSRDNQRLQKLQAVQDLSRVQQLKARQNSSGNLIMQMTPHFDQSGRYNGVPYTPDLPYELMGDGTFIPTPQSTSRTTPPRTTSRTSWKSNDPTERTYTQTYSQ